MSHDIEKPWHACCHNGVLANCAYIACSSAHVPPAGKWELAGQEVGTANAEQWQGMACSSYWAVQVIHDYCQQSFRLLALAKGVLKGLDREALCLMSQEQLEKHVEQFELLGLLVLSSHLRTDSEPTVTELQQQYGHSLDASVGTLCAPKNALGCDAEAMFAYVL